MEAISLGYNQQPTKIEVMKDAYKGSSSCLETIMNHYRLYLLHIIDISIYFSQRTRQVRMFWLQGAGS